MAVSSEWLFTAVFGGGVAMAMAVAVSAQAQIPLAWPINACT